MNTKQLAEIKARLEAATPGPWRTGAASKWEAANTVYFGPKRDDEAGRRLCRCYTSNPRPASDTIDDQDRANADFVANSWQDVQDLLAEVERLQGVIETFVGEPL